MFKEFQISILFDWQNGNTDLKKEHINGKGYPVVSSGVENTGIIGCTDVDARILPAHTITIDMFGNSYYRDFKYKEVTHARVFTLIPKGFELDIQTGLYLASSLKKLSKIYSYDNMCSYAKMSNMTILLPVIENPNPNHKYTVDDIDWKYMRDRITELEHDRITELDTYLKAAGLDDYELTDADKEIISLTAKRASDENRALEEVGDDEVILGEFLIENLFHKVDLKRIKKTFEKDKDLSREQTSEFSLPLINAKNGDNGIMYYGRPQDWESDTYCIDIVNDGAISTGNVYPQPQRTGVLYNAYMIKPNADIESEAILIYLAKSIEKVIKEQFGYDNKAVWEKVKVKSIYLPIKSDGTPDYEYMERYICALEKVVVADVVKYKDKMIKATKRIEATDE